MYKSIAHSVYQGVIDLCRVRLLAVLIAIATTSIIMCGCKKQPAAAEEHATHLAKRADAADMRIISLAPNITEILFALGSGDKLVGVTTYCNYPAETAGIQKVGSIMTPDIELIISLRPTYVFTTGTIMQENFARRLTSLGIESRNFTVNTVDDIMTTIREIGDICGAPARGSKLAADIQRRLNAYRQAAEKLQKKKTLVVVQPSPLIVVGDGTFISQLVGYAGGDCSFVKAKGQYPQLNSESLLVLSPEVIIITDTGYSEKERVEIKSQFNKWQTVPAVKDGYIYFLNADVISRPGPRVVQAVEALAHAIHPEFDWTNLAIDKH